MAKPPPGPVAFTVGAAPVPQQPGFSKLALASLILGVVAAIPFFWSNIDGWEGQDRTAVTFFSLSLALAVGAIVLGVMGMRHASQYVQSGLSMGFAVTGLVLGILAAIVDLFTVLVLLLFIALCGSLSAAAGSAASPIAGPWIPWMRSVAKVARRDVVGAVLAHHPASCSFRDDVHQVGRVRICAGCTGLVLGAGLAVGFVGVAGFGASWSYEWIAVGAVLAFVGAAPSVLRVPRNAWLRSASRIPLGAGLASYTLGLGLVPSSAAVLAFLAAALVSVALAGARAFDIRRRWLVDVGAPRVASV